MAPALSDGDLVLARMDILGEVGAVVLVRWNQRPQQLSIKRAVSEDAGRWYVLGDNADGSTDSRTLGPGIVLGVVRWRLWPHPGRLRSYSRRPAR
jgi:hypothetical protein